MKNKEIVRKILSLSKFRKLNPVQKKAIKMGLFKGRNLIVSSPTSSGKTLIAEMAGLNTALNKGKKMVYLCPLTALAREKFKEFKKYQKLKIKLALSIGDYDSADPWLFKKDWIIASNEKMDSLIRHGADWIKEIGLLVIDEVHLLNDFKRGPTLEILITLLKKIISQAQIIALSATIKNGKELASWLKGELVYSDYRPVPLYRGICSDFKITLEKGKKYFLEKEFSLEEEIVKDTLEREKQMIFFLSTRKNAESLGERISKIVNLYLSSEEKIKLEFLAQKILKALEKPTSQCRKLADCIRSGVAFYHAGLILKQKSLIEEAYKNKILKVITSTTALSYGINLPNFRAVIRDPKRYLPTVGMVFIPALEVSQMFGRSGRVQFDKWGEGILIAKNRKEGQELKRIYIRGELEEIRSRIASESALRTHILSLISSGFVGGKSDLLKFFSDTFFGFQIKKIKILEEKISEITSLLKEWDFIKGEEIITNGEIEEVYKATPLGKRISELYLDPFSGWQFKEALLSFQKPKTIPLFHLISSTSELKPLPSLSKEDIFKLEKTIEKFRDEFFIQIPDEFEEEYEDFMREVKLALVFFSWINEASEEKILKEFRITPGELRTKLTNADWLLYSLKEIGKIVGLSFEMARKINELRKRLYWGVKKELLSLIKLKGIGRVRARVLFNSGLINISKLKKASLLKISKILRSRKLAEKIKKEIKG